MDVHCSSCGEPWDTWHLLQDAIFETALQNEEPEAWRFLRFLRRSKKLTGRYRNDFRNVEWVLTHRASA